MRSSKSRSRNKNNRNRNSLGNVVNRVFDSSGPEGKVRGTPQQIIDKYNQLARDATLSNDRVAAENFQQHAEHYLRLLSEAQREQENRREQQERENRERQAQRDRDRAERDNTLSEQPEPQRRDPGSEPQPDVIDLGSGSSGPDIVDTPEARADAQPTPAPQASAAPEETKPQALGNGEAKTEEAKPSRRTRSPRSSAAKSEEANAEKPKKPRRPRKKAEPQDTAADAPAPVEVPPSEAAPDAAE